MDSFINKAKDFAESDQGKGLIVSIIELALAGSINFAPLNPAFVSYIRSPGPAEQGSWQPRKPRQPKQLRRQQRELTTST
ncbi:hypothetical protein IE81DRAFT_320685 [Ceraceosorus guamensis]|uniref:Uncharacterized protein n=1 Tax=Ceraceosorus guamensis TaxID=1522189 RepID=A0A316W5Z7_9BASI|nr:hypothetical protein IE81DRAFT_320685 [Ceraceosorus guamensis]PWN45084.1 hypothetical protein IE81DRAFT_320685 [Ceraceosorus guamensis]